MGKKISLLGRKAIPVWLLVLVLAAAGAGAAAGTVLAGKVVGEVPVAVSQALLVKSAVWVANLGTSDNYSTAPQQVRNHAGFVSMPNRSIGVVSDDNTGFQAAAEVAVGDWSAFDLNLKNASSNSLVGLVTLDVPEGLEVEVFADNTTPTNQAGNVVRIGPNTWKFTLAGGADPWTSGVISRLVVVVSADDTIQPGYYYITGTLQQIGY